MKRCLVGVLLKRGEMLRQWLDKWYGPTTGVVSGYLFIELSVISETAEALKSGEDITRFLRLSRGDVLNPKVAEATQKFLRMFSNDVFLSPLLRGDLIAVVVVELNDSRICVVGYGKEKWLCIFKTREREAKMIVTNILSLLGFSERTYKLSGTRILVEGLDCWVRKLFEGNDLEYVWVRDSFEMGGPLPKDLNLIIRAVQNLFESPFFASSLLLFLDQKSGRGIWCLRYHNEVSCVFSGLGGEPYNREVSEAIAEVYDCYVSGLAKLEPKEEEVTPAGEGSVEAEEAEVVKENEKRTTEIVTPVLQLNLSEIKGALYDVRERLAALEGRVNVIEGKLSSLLTACEAGGLAEKVDEKLRLIDEATARIRDFISEFSEKLQELRRHKNDLLRSIEDLSR
ncbi:MAG: hypothetical protein KIH01_03605 [Candidatus Freyarchaeota archaeon]|nr:hypothetical protein [Candidatus Jordarchaeia archaeon]